MYISLATYLSNIGCWRQRFYTPRIDYLSKCLPSGPLSNILWPWHLPLSNSHLSIYITQFTHRCLLLRIYLVWDMRLYSHTSSCLAILLQMSIIEHASMQNLSFHSAFKGVKAVRYWLSALTGVICIFGSMVFM